MNSDEPSSAQCAPATNAAPGRIGGVGIGTWLCLLGICLLFVALRWNSYDLPLDRDEGEYAYSGWLVRQGIAPYKHAFLQKPPMVAYSYALASVLAPNTLWAPRILACIFLASATALLGLIVRVEFGKGPALAAMWVVTPMLLLPQIEQCDANTEMFMLLPLTATVAVYTMHRKSGSAWPWFAAGILASLAFWYKYTALPVIALVFAAWAFEDWQHSRSTAQALARRWLSGLLGALVGSVAALAFFLVRDGGRHLWECTFQFNRLYVGTGTFGGSELWYYLQLFGRHWWVLFLALPVLFFKPNRRVWFWLVMFGVAWLATGFSCYGQYYLVVMPFWALLVAVAVDRLASWVSPRLHLPHQLLAGVITAVVVVLVCWSDLPLVLGSQDRLVSRASPPLKEALVTAGHLAEITSPQDRVFVAGSEPEILFYAHRISCTRFVIVYPLMIPTSAALRYQHEAIQDLQQNPPEAIVYVRDSESWLRQKETPGDFHAYLNKFLAEDYEICGGYVVEEHQRGWKSELTREDFGKSRMVLLKRKPSPTPAR